MSTINEHEWEMKELAVAELRSRKYVQWVVNYDCRRRETTDQEEDAWIALAQNGALRRGLTVVCEGRREWSSGTRRRCNAMCMARQEELLRQRGVPHTVTKAWDDYCC